MSYVFMALRWEDVRCVLPVLFCVTQWYRMFWGGCSAFFAALTSILAKIGIQNINSNLATAIRTAVVLIMSWCIVFITGKQGDIAGIGHKNLLFLILSGIATGLSWLCYYRALQIGEASKVIPIDKFSLVIGMVMAFVILKETISIKTIIGGALITVGTFVLIF